MTENGQNPETNPNPEPEIPVEGGELVQGPTVTMTFESGSIIVSRIMTVETAEDLAAQLMMYAQKAKQEYAAQQDGGEL